MDVVVQGVNPKQHICIVTVVVVVCTIYLFIYLLTMYGRHTRGI